MPPNYILFPVKKALVKAFMSLAPFT